MKKNPGLPQNAYTCNHYRQEMLLLSLTRRLEEDDLGEAEKEQLRCQIKKIEADLNMS